MLLIRAFPLSFAIFWRFLLVLPLWVIFYSVLLLFSVALFLGVANLSGIVLLILLPVFSLLGIAIAYIIAVHPYLVAIRIGLRVKGFSTNYSDKSVFGSAVGYGLFEAIAGSLIAFLFAVGAMLIAGQGIDFSTLRPAQITDPMASVARETLRTTPSILVLITAVAIMALRAAILPVLAQVAAGRSPDGTPLNPFGGFGHSFVPMMVLLIAITVFSAGVLPLFGRAVDVLGLVGLLTEELKDAVDLLVGQRQFAFNLNDSITLLIVILLSVWLFSLQCAGAVVAYEATATTSAKRKREKVEAVKADTPDIGDLLRSRMPKQR